VLKELTMMWGKKVVRLWVPKSAYWAMSSLEERGRPMRLEASEVKLISEDGTDADTSEVYKEVG